MLLNSYGSEITSCSGAIGSCGPGHNGNDNSNNGNGDGKGNKLSFEGLGVQKLIEFANWTYIGLADAKGNGQGNNGNGNGNGGGNGKGNNGNENDGCGDGKGTGALNGNGNGNAINNGKGNKYGLYKKLHDQFENNSEISSQVDALFETGEIENILSVIDNIVNGEVNLPEGEKPSLFKRVREVGQGYTLVGTNYTYNERNQLVHRSNEVRSEAHNYKYDGEGNLLTDGRSKYEWNDHGQLTKVTFPDGFGEKYKYDSRGRRLTIKEISNKSRIFTIKVIHGILLKKPTKMER